MRSVWSLVGVDVVIVNDDVVEIVGNVVAGVDVVVILDRNIDVVVVEVLVVVCVCCSYCPHGGPLRPHRRCGSHVPLA